MNSAETHIMSVYQDQRDDNGLNVCNYGGTMFTNSFIKIDTNLPPFHCRLLMAIKFSPDDDTPFY